MGPRHRKKAEPQPPLTDEERGKMLFEACVEPFGFSGRWGVGNHKAEEKWIRAARTFAYALSARTGELYTGGPRRG